MQYSINNYRESVMRLNKHGFIIERHSGKSNNLISTDTLHHIHKFYEIYFLISGKVRYYIDNCIYDLKSGDMVIIPPNTIHSTKYRDNERYERLLLNFDERILDKEGIRILNSLTVCIVSASSICKKNSEEIMLKLEEEFCSSNDEKEYMIRSYLMTLIVWLKRQIDIKRIAPKNAASSHMIINNCAKYISENYNSDITLSSISRIAAMSQSYFSRQFKKNMGFGFSEYLKITRLTHADKLLKTTNLPITTIATNCGFNDSNYFAAVFKEANGVTPYKYRKFFGAKE